ncbi:hypothetical protein BDA99DRAFT_557319 [Phascolomyces articulosus]|uniref:1-phosphatidylinositol-3-phosphate 5-kinase n=1 Tax=Phascolomyces articulosus TaxID=60185 RepID=A0AAD5PGT1_9FUNG|nr:hypothetical protein BDA99DRAFT_557319 [Phascolomyces articulosus]
MDANDITTLTSFNFDVPEGDDNDEWALSKIFTKFKAAVSGTQPAIVTTFNDQQQQQQHGGIGAGNKIDYHNRLEENISLITHDHHERECSQKRQSSPSSIQSNTRQIYVTSPTPPASTYCEPVGLRAPSSTAVTPINASASSSSSSTHENYDISNNSNNNAGCPAPSDNNNNNEDHQHQMTTSSSSTILPGSFADYLPISKTQSVDSSDAQSISTTFSISTSHSLSRIIARLRGQKSDKEFWMSDEQCKECYKCRKPFKLLRRRHHCRICGQIFCGKCASHTISGKRYNQKGELRVCNFCYDEHNLANRNDPLLMPVEQEVPILDYYDSESVSSQPYQVSQQQQQEGPVIPSQPPPIAAPKMHIPTTAVKHPHLHGHQFYGDSDATTVQLEIAAGPHSSSSTSGAGGGGKLSRSGSISAETDKDDGGLKRLLDAGTSLLRRPRSNTSTSFIMDDNNGTPASSSTPFLQSNHYDTMMDRGGGTLVAERELSPFMGSRSLDDDEENGLLEHQLYDLWSRPSSVPGGGTTRMPSSGSNQSQSLKLSDIMVSRDSFGSDDEAYDNRLRAKRTEELRGHVGPLERSLSLRRQSISGHHHHPRPTSRSSNRQPRKTNMRINTTNLPKADYALLQSEGWSPAPFMSPSLEDRSAIKSRLLTPRNRRISAPPPNIELSIGALMHARRMLKQLMADPSFDELTQQSKSEWEEIITNFLLKITDNVRPDVRSGDDMDIRHYIKIKKVPGGVPSDSFYIKGVMCSKNVAHKKMVRNIAQPKILILLFSLDYSRVEMENQLMSIAPVLSQEREHISKLVARIVALRPSLLLVKSTVSRLALEYLLEANIPVIHNVKYSVIEAVARCTRATIVPSVDKLQLGSLSFGHCGMFEIRTLMHEWLPNRRKTYLIFDECQPDLGGTIVLRGAPNETLRLIKRLLDFMVFIVNNLKLETSLLRDSFAKNRSSDQQQLEDEQPQKMDTSASPSPTAISSKVEDDEKESKTTMTSPPPLPLPPAFQLEAESFATLSAVASTEASSVDAFIKLYQDTVLSASQFVVFPQPYLLMCLKESNDKLASLNSTRKMTIASSPTRSIFEQRQGGNGSVSGSTATTPAAGTTTNTSTTTSSEHGLSLDAEFEQLVVKRNQLMRSWSAYLRENPDQLNPFCHQSIIILYSNVCTVTTVPCQGPEIRLFEYYCEPSDITLGNYIYDLCHDATQPCASNMCEHTELDHYRSYAHGNARINVIIQSFPCPQPGMSEKILMWSYCRKCEKPTPVIPMSENTWNYSFGKFLEVCLYQKGVHCRADICPHDIGLYHVRYFGYRDFAVRFEYDRIDLLEVAVPPMKLFTLSKVHIDLKEAAFKSLRTKINKFYQSIIERNKVFPFDLVDPRKLEACKAELQELSQRCDGEKKQVLQLLQTQYATSEPNDTLTINWVQQILYREIAAWDVEYADLVRYYLQPERELRKITANHLRKVFPPEATLPGEVNGEQRTRRAAEVTDLPMLGTELDNDDYYFDEEDEEVDLHALIMQPPKMLPQLCQPSSDESEPEEEPSDKKLLLRPDIRRRLSLELMREFNAKFRSEEPTRGGINDKNNMNQVANKVKSPGLPASATITPSRIPVLHLGHQNKAKLSPPLYDNIPPPLRVSKQRPFVDDLMTSGSASGGIGRRRTILPDYRYNLLLNDVNSPHHASSSNSASTGRTHYPPPLGSSVATPRYPIRPAGIGAAKTDDPRNMIRKSTGGGGSGTTGVTPRNSERQFRSRLPRKKTLMQVYTHANDLVQENMEDEFPDETVLATANSVASGMTTRTLDEGTKPVDYFSPMAPYTNHVNHPRKNQSFLSQRYHGVAEAITGFGMELERNPPPAVDLLDPPPVSIIAGVSSSDIRDNEENNTEDRDADEETLDGVEIMRHRGYDDASKAQPEKSSLMKTITNFLTDSGVANLLPLEYPLQPTEHVFPDSLVIVSEEKPSTIIAYTLSCEEYLAHMRGPMSDKASITDDTSTLGGGGGYGTTDYPPMEMESSSESIADNIQETLLRGTGVHIGCNFRLGSTKFFCKVFFVEQFDALRRNCGFENSYILSLASCVKWDTSGGKSGSAFLKTSDDRLLMKQVSRFEMDAFLGFAPAYFHYMSEAFFRELPTVLAKIFGFYTIGYKNSANGKSMRMDVVVMENLFYQRKVKKIFDLKGSMRNRHVQSTGKQDEVLLDENLVESHSKEILRSSLHNDTLFLSKWNVMDYSLLVGIDEDRQELVVGIVDFIRTFTWDKKLESWVKESGILGGGGKGPTIISPRQYRIRFREAMERYFLMVPDEWSLTRQIRGPPAEFFHHQQQQHLMTEQSLQDSPMETD